MDTKAVLSVFVLLAVCNTYAENEITVSMPKDLVGDVFYVHVNGKSKLECNVSGATPDEYANSITWEYQSSTVPGKIVSSPEGNRYAIDVDGKSTGVYICKYTDSKGAVSQKSVTVKTVGPDVLSVQLYMETKASTVIKDDTPPLDFVCITGGDATQLVVTGNDVLIIHKGDDGQDHRLFQNGNTLAAKKDEFGLQLLGFGGYDASKNIFLHFRINKPHPAIVGTLRCERQKTYTSEIVFTDSEDMQSMSFSLVNSANQPVLKNEIQPGDAHKKTSSVVVRPGKYTVKCSAVGGHPPPTINLRQNGVVVPADNPSQGKEVQLSTSDTHLSCDAAVPKHHKREIIFKLNVEDEPVPIKCDDRKPSPGDTMFKRVCNIGTSNKIAHCKDVFFEVKNLKTDAVDKFVSGTKKEDGTNAYCFVEKEGAEYKIKFSIEFVGNENMQNKEIILYHQVGQRTQRLNAMELGALEDVSTAAGLSSMGVVSLLCLAVCAMLL